MDVDRYLVDFIFDKNAVNYPS